LRYVLLPSYPTCQQFLCI